MVKRWVHGSTTLSHPDQENWLAREGIEIVIGTETQKKLQKYEWEKDPMGMISRKVCMQPGHSERLGWNKSWNAGKGGIIPGPQGQDKKLELDTKG